MHTTNIWSKFDLHWSKVVILVLLFLVISKGNTFSQATSTSDMNNPNYDNRRTFTYGFSIGFHNSAFQLKYSDAFVNDLDSVTAIYPKWALGFSLGFIVNARVAEFLDARVTPKVGFYEYKLEFEYTGNIETLTVVKEATVVELPLLLKFKSARRKNTRMYFIGGLNPAIEASGKSDLEEDQDRLQLNRFNLSAEIGFGFDIYYPLFKFSPEIRYSIGMLDVLSPTKNNVSAGIDHLNTHVIAFYFHFQ